MTVMSSDETLPMSVTIAIIKAKKIQASICQVPYGKYRERQ